MENMDLNLSRRLEEEINLSGEEDDINNQTLPNAGILDSQVDEQIAQSTHPTSSQLTSEDSQKRGRERIDPMYGP